MFRTYQTWLSLFKTLLPTRSTQSLAGDTPFFPTRTKLLFILSWILQQISLLCVNRLVSHDSTWALNFAETFVGLLTSSSSRCCHYVILLSRSRLIFPQTIPEENDQQYWSIKINFCLKIHTLLCPQTYTRFISLCTKQLQSFSEFHIEKNQI